VRSLPAVSLVQCAHYVTARYLVNDIAGRQNMLAVRGQKMTDVTALIRCILP